MTKRLYARCLRWFAAMLFVSILFVAFDVRAELTNSLSRAFAKDHDHFAYTVPRMGTFNGVQRYFICTATITWANDVVYNVVYLFGDYAKVVRVHESEERWNYCDAINHDWFVYKKFE